MKLACNYYQETEDLVREGKIDIDYFKYPALTSQIDIFNPDRKVELESFLQRVASIKPILMHGLYPSPPNLTSSDMINTFNPSAYDSLIDMTRTPGLSFHLTLTALKPHAIFDDVAHTIIHNIKYLKKVFNHMEFLAVENIDGLDYGELTDPRCITNIVNMADCDFLLDISHALCMSRHRKEDLRSYLYRLPLNKISEIHINGWICAESNIMCHTAINETGYQVLGDLLDICDPRIITIEYGRDNDRINAGIPLLSPDRQNDRAKLEITEQVSRIRAILREKRP